MQPSIVMVLTRAYALNLFFIARALIKLLTPKLSIVELEYVEKTGPAILDQELLHDLCTTNCTSPQGKDARREAARLEALAKQKLDKARVSNERQLLLKDLLIAANADFINHFPPRKEEQIHYHMSEGANSDTFRRFKDVADLLGAPEEICSFLDLLEQQATLLIQERKRA